MEKQNRLPDVIFISQKASEFLESKITEAGACIVADAKGISIEEASSCADEVDKATEYRNIVQLWHPATEKPNCICSILCWCLNGVHFTHDHYSDNDEYWRMFVSENEVRYYCYLSELEPECFF